MPECPLQPAPFVPFFFPSASVDKPHYCGGGLLWLSSFSSGEIGSTLVHMPPPRSSLSVPLERQAKHAYAYLFLYIVSSLVSSIRNIKLSVG